MKLFSQTRPVASLSIVVTRKGRSYDLGTAGTLGFRWRVFLLRLRRLVEK